MMQISAQKREREKNVVDIYMARETRAAYFVGVREVLELELDGMEVLAVALLGLRARTLREVRFRFGRRARRHLALQLVRYHLCVAPCRQEVIPKKKNIHI
jgi:hypothetical protein